MRSIVPFAIVGLFSLSAWGQQAKPASKAPSQPASQQPAAVMDLSCFENLPTPEYPMAALHQHVDGSVWTWVDVTPQGSPGKVETQVVSAWGDGPKLLVPPVEKAVHEAKIKPDCAGKKLAVVFRYELHGQPTANPKVTSRQEKPDIVWIESQPAETTQTASRSASH